MGQQKMKINSYYRSESFGSRVCEHLLDANTVIQERRDCSQELKIIPPPSHLIFIAAST
jgi:hypothetical protein